MTEYEITDKIPLPPLVRATGRPPLYPTAQLKIGESFFVGNANADILRRVVHTTARAHGMVVSTRKVRENNINGMRIWRTA